MAGGLRLSAEGLAHLVGDLLALITLSPAFVLALQGTANTPAGVNHLLIIFWCVG